MLRKHSLPFIVGFCAAIVALLSLSVLALARGKESARTEAIKVRTTSTLSERLGVFSKPRASSDALPSNVRAVAEGLTTGTENVPTQLLPGDSVISESRLLLSHVGSWGASLYAWPTTKGRVCYVLTGAAATCEGDFTEAHPFGSGFFDRDELGSGEPGGVLGLVPDDVVSVDIVTASETYSTQVVNNALFFQLPDSTIVAPTALIAHYSDGTERSVRIPPPSGAALR